MLKCFGIRTRFFEDIRIYSSNDDDDYGLPQVEDGHFPVHGHGGEHCAGVGGPRDVVNLAQNIMVNKNSSIFCIKLRNLPIFNKVLGKLI